MNQTTASTPQTDQWSGPALTSLKNAGSKTSVGFNKLSTTQKVVGGALLALGVGYLARSKGGSKTSSTAATLNELLYFVNDRIAGYKRAVAESHNPELRGYYKQLVSQSQQFSTDLNTYLSREGRGRQTSTTLKGKLYRRWMDTQAALTGSDEKAILGANIYGEEWALKAYQEALADPKLTGEIRRTVERQYELSQNTYRRLKTLEVSQ
ncbi:PA2169 family four-helix-bundle protein [Hymenobacter endophyticus]|uniref:PA2169 family four-helix-bundle protein n=1 Tax=Hymenobacter endophyticus TaxID=3076335 RepID=A0ABU3TDH9_9BACT|nr:PA2169 family four-helix-bundle protein [Hymenobacter endophyticus]MDU0369431.1 PA2169 family four-helix-bundle protein [Hymenobacter endophyticus]